MKNTEIRLLDFPNDIYRPAEESGHHWVCADGEYAALPSLLYTLVVCFT